MAATGMQLAVELAGRLEIPMILQNIISLLARCLQPLDGALDKHEVNSLLALIVQSIRTNIHTFADSSSIHALQVWRMSDLLTRPQKDVLEELNIYLGYSGSS